MIFQEGHNSEPKGRNAGAAAEGLRFSETIILRLVSPGLLVLLLSEICFHEAGLNTLKIGKHNSVTRIRLVCVVWCSK